MTPRAHNLLSYLVALFVLPMGLLLAADFELTRIGAPAWLATSLWVVHFARRSLEAGFVHRYSKPSFPLSDAITEYVYYWGFGGWIGWSLATADATADPPSGAAMVVGVGVFAVAQVGNARSHTLLARLRSDDAGAFVIPRGFLFELVSCPHYMFEILSWVGFAMVTQMWASAAFLVVASGILGSWAWQRHKNYRQRFDSQSGDPYPSTRKALIPYVF